MRYLWQWSSSSFPSRLHFPEHHSLEIIALESSEITLDETPSQPPQIQLVSVIRNNEPGGSGINIDPSEIEVSGDWQTLPDNSLLWSGGDPGGIHYESFMQAGIELIFTTGPGQGTVKILWDGNEKLLDLANLPAPSHTEYLKPAFNLAKADALRKILVVTAWIAEFIALTILITITSLSLYLGLRDRVIIRNPGMLAGSSAVFIILLIATFSYIKPVQFEDKNLENLIRITLNNPDRPIYKHQLLTIASLDGTHKYISSLEGIQNLGNLSELKLRRNQIRDLNPISHLKHLKTLNLRENPVTDLTPLAENTGLVYLNLYSDTGITSIAPLAGLTNLETLILGEVAVEEEISILEGFPLLKHLNLRSSGITDLSPLAGLANLEYLNLYSNYRIQSIAPLAGLTDLQTLILGDVPVEDKVHLLGGLTNLEHLNLRNTGIIDLSPLSSFSHLGYLNLHSNPGIKSLAPIAALSNLQTLILQNVPVEDQVGILSNFPHLTKLNLRNTGITDTTVIGQLLTDGAFKDDPGQKLQAYINLYDNPLDYESSDSYAPLRPFWENISLRVPYTLPEHKTLQPPAFSHPAGFYSDGFLLELTAAEPGTTIHYTMDGSEPSLFSPLYTSPIPIESREGEPNILSEIQNTSPYWKEPDGEVFKASVVKAKVFHDQSLARSATLTQTYFVDEDIHDRYSLPVFSIVTDRDYLFDYVEGFYVKGLIYDEYYNATIRNLTNVDANYYQEAVEWERPVHVEIFEPNGEPAFSQYGSVHIHGHATRVLPQKSLRFFARSEYDPKGIFEYELFPGTNNRINSQSIQQFENFILRNSGNDWHLAFMRDALMQRLVNHTGLDTMAYRPVIVFINGEYWGIHDLRQRLDENYLASAYLVNAADTGILEYDGLTLIGSPDEMRDYTDMLNFIGENDLSAQENYEYIQTRVDVENFIDYTASEIYSANADWPHNNIKFWRLKTGQYNPEALPGQDGRWRWMLFDTDLGFGLNKGHGSYLHRTLDIATAYDNKGFLLSSLLQNEEFKIQFINRTADHLNTSFKEEHVLDTIDNMKAVLQPDIEEHIRRWRSLGDSVGAWEENVNVLREFAANRPDYMRQHFIEHFGLQGTATLTVQSDSNMGYIQVNSIAINPETPGVVDPGNWSGIYFKGIPIQVTAIPKPGYRFSGWESLDNEQTDITLNLVKNVTLKALFIPDY